jgi:hypothetical protein
MYFQSKIFIQQQKIIKVLMTTNFQKIQLAAILKIQLASQPAAPRLRPRQEHHTAFGFGDRAPRCTLARHGSWDQTLLQLRKKIKLKNLI